MGKVSITLSGISEIAKNLNYKEGSVKYKALEAIRSFYTAEDAVTTLQEIDTDTLIPMIWDTGDAPDRIRSKRRNFSSIKSAINADLEKLVKKDQNPENIIIAESNIFDMTEEAKTNLLYSFTDAVKTGDIDLEKATGILKAVTEFLGTLDLPETEAQSLDIVNEIRNVLSKMGRQFFLNREEETEIVEEAEEETVELDEDEVLEEIDDDEDIETIELDEDEVIEEIDEDELIETDDDQEIEEIELDEDQEIEEVEDEDIEEIELDQDEEIEEIDDDVEEIELDEDQEIQELDDDLEELELGEDETIEEFDEDELIETDENEDIEELELDEDQEIEEVEDEDIEEIELDQDEEIEEVEEVDGDVEEIELDEDEQIEEIEEDQEIEEVEDNLEALTLDEDEEIEEIQLDADEALEELDELDQDEQEALESFRKNREMADFFDEALGEREKKFNAYLKIPQGMYTIGTKKSLKSSLELQQFHMPLVYMGKYPVTNSLFEIFIEQTGYVTTAEKKGHGTVYHARYKKKGGGIIWKKQAGAEDIKGACWYQPNGPGSSLHGKRNHPVVQISVEDAFVYASWIGRRLPSEAEWEAAARTDLGLKFPWGQTFDPAALNIESTGFSDTTPVDQYDAYANEFGLADMLGNVMEWTADMEYPTFKTRKKEKFCVAKGGAWNAAETITISARGLYPLGFTANTIGFRCVSELFQ